MVNIYCALQLTHILNKLEEIIMTIIDALFLNPAILLDEERRIAGFGEGREGGGGVG